MKRLVYVVAVAVAIATFVVVGFEGGRWIVILLMPSLLWCSCCEKTVNITGRKCEDMGQRWRVEWKWSKVSKKSQGGEESVIVWPCWGLKITNG